MEVAAEAIAPISITNLAERHLRLLLNMTLTGSPSSVISITNLAERHLRLGRELRLGQPHRGGDINHESSRKAFETRARATGARSRASD